MVSNANNWYPEPRTATLEVSDDLLAGYQESALQEFGQAAQFEMQDLNALFEKQLKGAPVVYVVVGNKKQIDMKQLEQFGEVIFVKQKEIFKR